MPNFAVKFVGLLFVFTVSGCTENSTSAMRRDSNGGSQTNQTRGGKMGSSTSDMIKFRLLGELVPADLPYPGTPNPTKFAYDGEIDRRILDYDEKAFVNGKMLPSRAISIKLPHKETPACKGLAQYHTALGFSRPGTPVRTAENRTGRTWEPTGNKIEGLDEYINKTPMYSEVEGYLYANPKRTMVVVCIKQDFGPPPYKTMCTSNLETKITDRTDVSLHSGPSLTSIDPDIHLIIRRMRCNAEQLPELFSAGKITRGEDAWR